METINEYIKRKTAEDDREHFANVEYQDVGVCVGMDAMRICIGQKPKNFPAKDIEKWFRIMKKLLSISILAAILLSHAAAFAACTTETIFINGRMITCTTCCFGPSSCTTNCF